MPLIILLIETVEIFSRGQAPPREAKMTETEFIDAVREMQNDPLKVLFVFTCPTRQGTARYLNGFVQWRRNGSEYYSFPIEDADFLQQLDAGSPTKG